MSCHVVDDEMRWKKLVRVWLHDKSGTRLIAKRDTRKNWTWDAGQHQHSSEIWQFHQLLAFDSDDVHEFL
jgi:hypothetical protein